VAQSERASHISRAGYLHSKEPKVRRVLFEQEKALRKNWGLNFWAKVSI